MQHSALHPSVSFPSVLRIYIHVHVRCTRIIPFYLWAANWAISIGAENWTTAFYSLVGIFADLSVVTCAACTYTHKHRYTHIHIQINKTSASHVQMSRRTQTHEQINIQTSGGGCVGGWVEVDGLECFLCNGKPLTPLKWRGWSARASSVATTWHICLGSRQKFNHPARPPRVRPTECLSSNSLC